jgi:hypothetical protein
MEQEHRNQYSDWLKSPGFEFRCGNKISLAQHCKVHGWVSTPSSIELKMSEAVSISIFRTAPHTNFSSLLSHYSQYHNGCLADFCLKKAIKRHKIHFVYRCLLYIYLFCKILITFTETFSCRQCGKLENYVISIITSFLFVCHLKMWQTRHVDLDNVQ